MKKQEDFALPKKRHKREIQIDNDKYDDNLYKSDEDDQLLKLTGKRKVKDKSKAFLKSYNKAEKILTSPFFSYNNWDDIDVMNIEWEKV